MTQYKLVPASVKAQAVYSIVFELLMDKTRDSIDIITEDELKGSFRVFAWGAAYVQSIKKNCGRVSEKLEQDASKMMIEALNILYEGGNR